MLSNKLVQPSKHALGKLNPLLAGKTTGGNVSVEAVEKSFKLDHGRVQPIKHRPDNPAPPATRETAGGDVGIEADQQVAQFGDGIKGHGDGPLRIRRTRVPETAK